MKDKSESKARRHSAVPVLLIVRRRAAKLFYG
jgi:hypothetical protein